MLNKAVAWPVLEKQLEDVGFLKELQNICHMIESDGLNAGNPGMTGLNISSFPQELMNVINNPINLSIDTLHPKTMNKDLTNEYNIYENCESVSLEMLAKSYTTQVTNNIKNKIPKDISILSSVLQNSKKPMKYEKAVNFITYLLDITTHIGYYKKPVDPSLAVFVQAQFDGYMPNMECPSPQDLWPGCEIKYVDSGHIFAALYKQDVFRKIISDTLNRC